MTTRRPHRARPGLEALEPRQLFAAGMLDTTFAGDGTYDHPAGGPQVGRALAVQPDGRIVAIGSMLVGVPTAGGGATIFRLTSGGQPDFSFQATGLTDYKYDLRDVLVQPDGDVVIAGTLRRTQASPDVAMLLRLNANGSLDTSFGAGGFAFPLGQQMPGRVTSVTRLDDGQLLYTGYGRPVGTQPVYDVFVGRLDADGRPDASYGQDGPGITHYNQGNAFTSPFDILALPDGGALVSGWGRSGTDQSAAFIRLTPDGHRDLSFGSGGVKVSLDPTIEGYYALELAPDGMIVGAGYSHSGALLSRFDADAVLDPAFGAAGHVRLPERLFPNFTGLSVDPSGRVHAAGFTFDGSGGMSILASYLPDGTFDPGFNGGKPVVAPRYTYQALAASAPGHVVAVGWGQQAGATTLSDVAIASYTVNTGTSSSAPAPRPAPTPTPSPAPAPTPEPEPAPEPEPSPDPAPALPPVMPTPRPLETSLSASLPAQPIGAGVTTARAALQLSNRSAAPLAGQASVHLLLSDDPLADPADAEVGVTRARLNLRSGASKRLALKLRAAPQVADGTYYLLARIARPGEADEVVAASSVVSVAVPQAELHVAAPVLLLPSGASAAAGGPIQASLAIENRGPATARGTVAVTLYAQPLDDAGAGAGGERVPLAATRTVRVNLRPGASATVRLRLALPRALSRGSYSVTADVSAAGVPGASLPGGGLATALTPLTIS